MLDIRSRLQHNSENQRLVAREADHLQLEMMAQQTQTKMKVNLLQIGHLWGKIYNNYYCTCRVFLCVCVGGRGCVRGRPHMHDGIEYTHLLIFTNAGNLYK